MEKIAHKYLLAVLEAGQIYRHIAQAKGAGYFRDRSVHGRDRHAANAGGIACHPGGVERRSHPLANHRARNSPAASTKALITWGTSPNSRKNSTRTWRSSRLPSKNTVFPASLKLSVHSGSDKFSIYGAIRRALRRSGAGVHVKTAGTTWLEEIIGLAAAGGGGLDLAKEIYAGRWSILTICARRTRPCWTLTVADCRRPPTVDRWDSAQFVSAVRHDPKNPAYNRSARQLLHVGYKIAAEKGKRYIKALEQYKSSVAANVTENLYERHVKPLFLAGDLT